MYGTGSGMLKDKTMPYWLVAWQLLNTVAEDETKIMTLSLKQIYFLRGYALFFESLWVDARRSANESMIAVYMPRVNSMGETSPGLLWSMIRKRAREAVSNRDSCYLSHRSR